MTERRQPLVLDLGAGEAPDPAAAPPVPEAGEPAPPAMARAAAFAAGGGSPLGRWAWGLAGAVLSLVVTLAAWDWAARLVARAPVLGAVAGVALAALAAVLLLIAGRELAALLRLGRIDHIQRAAAEARVNADLAAARRVAADLDGLYARRADLAWGRARLGDLGPSQFDAEGVLDLAETALMAPLDALAAREVEAAARRVAMVTALAPMALVDVATALAANLAMIRRIAVIYGGRSGALGAWRLTRQVMTHLLATGMVAVGDDMIGSVAGGSLLSKLSRRFGEGVINGALTARVGVAAIEVCRPLPFAATPRPQVTALVRRALTGLFGQDGAALPG